MEMIIMSIAPRNQMQSTTNVLLSSYVLPYSLRHCAQNYLEFFSLPSRCGHFLLVGARSPFQLSGRLSGLDVPIVFYVTQL